MSNYPDHQLAELLVEEFKELRWRRDIEDRLVRWTMSISSILIPGSIALAEYAAKPLFIVYSIVSAAMIAGFGIRICDKIKAENSVYQGVGRTIVAILANKHKFGSTDGTAPDIGEDIEKIGTGDGYKETIKIVGFTTSITALALLAIGLVKVLV